MFTNERPIPSAGGLLFLPLDDYYSFPHRISIPSAIGLLSLRLKGRLAGRGGTVCNRYKLEIL